MRDAGTPAGQVLRAPSLSAAAPRHTEWQAADVAGICDTLVDVLLFRARMQPEREAFIFPCDVPEQARGLTYGRLEQWARRIGADLLARGVRPGERVVLLFPTSLEYIAAFFATLLIGAVAVPTYPLFRPRRRRLLRRLMRDAVPACVLASPALLVEGRECFAGDPELGHLPWVAVEEPLPAGILAEVAVPVFPAPPPPTALAMLQYTSGSTGSPKGVMVTHANLLAQVGSIYHWLRRPPTTPGQTWLPLYHDMGLIGAILYPFYAGFPVGVMSPLSFIQRPARWLEAITALGATVSGAANFAYDLCVERVSDAELERLDLSSWRWAFMGSEPIREATIERFVARFGRCGFRREALLPAYGCAESTIMVAGRGFDTPGPLYRDVAAEELARGRVRCVGAGEAGAVRLVSSGRALADHRLEIVDPDTREILGAGRVGEIWVQGSGVTRGYFRRPDATRATFEARTATGEGPFLRTGDLGFLLDGELFVTSRLKDLIIVAGRNHHPPDIEASAEAAHPLLEPSGCAAFSIDGEHGTEEVVLVAELRRRVRLVAPGAGEDTGSDAPSAAVKRGGGWRRVAAAEIVAAVRRAVAAGHDLSVREVVLLRPASLPRTTSGKIQRRAAREGYRAGTLRRADAAREV